MSKVVLDASALLAFLRNETGADKVAAELEKGTYMSAANWAETLSKIAELGVDCQRLIDTLRQQGILGGALVIVLLNEEDALNIAKLRPMTKSRGLSLGDRACLALAVRLKALVLTTDQSWQDIALDHIKVEMIR